MIKNVLFKLIMLCILSQSFDLFASISPPSKEVEAVVCDSDSEILPFSIGGKLGRFFTVIGLSFDLIMDISKITNEFKQRIDDFSFKKILRPTRLSDSIQRSKALIIIENVIESVQLYKKENNKIIESYFSSVELEFKKDFSVKGAVEVSLANLQNTFNQSKKKSDHFFEKNLEKLRLSIEVIYLIEKCEREKSFMIEDGEIVINNDDDFDLYNRLIDQIYDRI